MLCSCTTSKEEIKVHEGSSELSGRYDENKLYIIYERKGSEVIVSTDIQFQKISLSLKCEQQEKLSKDVYAEESIS